MGVTNQDAEYKEAVDNSGGSSSIAVRTWDWSEKIPWVPHSGYQPTQDGNLLSSWGREYTFHAVDGTMPGGLHGYGHSIAPCFVEETIARGDMSFDSKNNSSVFSLGDVKVATTLDEQRVITVMKTR